MKTARDDVRRVREPHDLTYAGPTGPPNGGGGYTIGGLLPGNGPGLGSGRGTGWTGGFVGGRGTVGSDNRKALDGMSRASKASIAGMKRRRCMSLLLGNQYVFEREPDVHLEVHHQSQGGVRTCMVTFCSNHRPRFEACGKKSVL